MKNVEVTDLRSALKLIQSIPGVYRHVGAAGTVMRPTKIGPAMMFQNIKGHPDSRVIIGMLASRKRVAALLGTTPE